MRRRLFDRSAIPAAALLAIGVGATASAFTVTRVLSPSGLPYPDADRLVIARVGGPSWSPAMLDAVTASTTVFDRVAGFQERAATITDGSPARLAAEIVRLESVSAAYFEMLGAAPARGRVFETEEDRRDGASAIAIISDALWKRRFGRDPAILGRAIVVDGRVLDVIGVMPARFSGLIGRTDVWTPLGSARWLSGDTGPERPTSRWFEVMARRRTGVTLDAAQARFAAEAAPAILQIPAGDRIVNSRTMLTVTPLATARVPAVFPQAARILTLAVAVVLMLVVVNLTSLHLLRMDARRRELAIRVAMGASLRQLAAMALRESTMVALMGAVGALLLRPLFLAALAAVQPNSTSFGIVTARMLTADTLRLDVATAAVTIGLALVASLPLALALIVRAHDVNIDQALRRRGVAVAGLSRPGRRPTRAILVIVQATLACAVVGAGALLTRSADQLLDRERGYEFEGVTTARVNLPDTFDTARASLFYADVVSRLAQTPGITSASVSNCAPGGGRCRRSNLSAVDGRAIEPGAAPTVGINYVTPGHFVTIGTRTAAGRLIEEADRADTERVVVITVPLAKQLWPGQDPIGHTLDIFTANGSLDGSRRVVGTIEPIAFNLEADPGLDVFLPATQAAWSSGVIFVKGTGGAGHATRVIADVVSSIDRAVPVFDAGGLDVPLERSLQIESFLRRTLLAFGLLGLLLAAFGTYAIVAQSVAESRRELAIRVALGATPRQIRSLVSLRGVVIALASALAGFAGAVWSGALLRSFLHGLAPTDPIALATGPAITMLAVLTAVAVPALRASRANPVAGIRADH